MFAYKILNKHINRCSGNAGLNFLRIQHKVICLPEEVNTETSRGREVSHNFSKLRMINPEPLPHANIRNFKDNGHTNPVGYNHGKKDSACKILCISISTHVNLLQLIYCRFYCTNEYSKTGAESILVKSIFFLADNFEDQICRSLFLYLRENLFHSVA